MTVTTFSGANAHIFGTVRVMGVSPVAAFGMIVEGAFYGERGSSNTDLINGDFGDMNEVVPGRVTGGSAQGSLKWNGTTLQYATPAVAYLDMHIDVEFHVYDGGTITFLPAQDLN